MAGSPDGVLDSVLSQHRRNAAYVLTVAVLTNVALVVIFWFWRVLLFNDNGDTASTGVGKHFAVTPQRKLSSWGDSLFVSIMNQSTIGCTSIVPVSDHAVAVTSTQGFFVILVYFTAIVLLLI